MNLHLNGTLAPTVTEFIDMGKDKDMDGYGWRAVEVLSSIASVLGGLVILAIVAAVLYFLLRFLIVGTRAAQLYIDQNSATAPPTPGAPDPYSPGSGSTGPGSTGPVAKDLGAPHPGSPDAGTSEQVADGLGAAQPGSTGTEADPVRTMKLPTSSDTATIPLTPPSSARTARAPRTPKPSE